MGQNSSIKEIATTPDILVSLYLKATRDGDSALERPSIQNFKNELKSLAGMMGELDRPASGAVSAGPAQPVYQAPPPPPTQAPVTHVPPQQAHVPQPVHVPQVTPTQTQVSYTEKTVTAMTRPTNLLEALDCGSQQMIQEVKEEFNLSSDLEVVRMLIKIGYVKSKGMLK
ncbi:hypothetical protein [Bdellovibrio sp. NC01]|uniref:hypothetical protein n=1 Tax=Bdellovibrio sp. NC01 TaxID=2220073 RepID=UPI001FEFF8EB|nr:hypothetical protein [Bdellovibrio sp. NC01]